MHSLSRVRAARTNRRVARRRPWRWVKRLMLLSAFTCTTLALLGLIFLFGTKTGEDLREWTAGTLLTTQHDYWAPYTFLPEEKLNALKEQIRHPEVVNSESQTQTTTSVEPSKPVTVPQPEKPRELVEIEEINVSKGNYYFKGKIMYISDPTRVQLLVTTRKDRGDLLDEFVKKSNAIGIVNASGFADPDGYGKGAKAYGVVIHNGKILQGYNPKKSGETALGITYEGKLITGSYTAEQMIKMGVKDAMSFRPQLIVNGKNLFVDKPARSWGIQPRTAIGQKADGTIVFLVIDGRQPGHSIGASMNDLAELLEQRGVVTAMAMDGGSSSMMLHEGEAITKTSCPYYRGRYLPNAWAVI